MYSIIYLILYLKIFLINLQKNYKNIHLNTHYIFIMLISIIIKIKSSNIKLFKNKYKNKINLTCIFANFMNYNVEIIN